MLLVKTPSPPLRSTLVRQEEEEEEKVHDEARLLKALADPNRLRILNLLLHQEDMICVQEIVKKFTLQQPTISHHLRILRDARLVTSRKDELFVYYRVRRETLLRAQAIIEDLLAIKVDGV